MLNSKILFASLVGLTACLAAPARADFNDAANDFLSTYTGTHGGDLDVLSGNVTVSPTEFVFHTKLNGAVGTTAGGVYVWGLDRGQGTARFDTGTNPIGSGVLFDSILIVTPTGAGTVRDLINGTVKTLAPSDVLISGDTITAHVGVGLLPTEGKSLDQYTWNLWPRQNATTNVGNAAISDFAPDNSNFHVQAVPELGAAAWLIPAAGSALCLLRRRRGVKTGV